MSVNGDRTSTARGRPAHAGSAALRDVPGRRRPSHWTNLGLWALSLAAATGLWFFVNTGDGTEDRTMRVRIETKSLPPGLVVTNALTEHVEIRVSGPSVIVGAIDPRRLRAEVDLSSAQPPRVRVNLDRANFSLPRKVEVKRIVPSSAIFDVDRLATRTVPVRLERRGEPRPGQRIGGIEIVPDRVSVSGPAQAVEALKDVPTRAVDLGTLDEGAQVEVELETAGGLLRSQPARVLVRFDMETLHEERRFSGVPVRAGDGSAWSTSPEAVALLVRGPREVVDQLALDEGSVYVDVEGHAPGGAFRAKPRVQLPRDVELVRMEPDEVTVQPARPGAAAGPRLERRH